MTPVGGRVVMEGVCNEGMQNRGCTGFEPGRAIAPIPHYNIGIVPLKNGQEDNLSPSKFREKTRKEAHTKRFISVQKLQAETERGKYILLHL